jgi:phospholipid transport system substrate-binding protein
MTVPYRRKDVFYHLVNVVFSPFRWMPMDKGTPPVMIKLKKRLIILLMLGVCQSTAIMAAETAGLTVDNLHNNLIESMKAAENSSFQARYSMLEPVILAEFDFDSIARIVIGRDWKDLSQEKQQSFLDKFSALSIATYVSRFDGFSGESFVVDEIDQKKPDQVIVKTRLITSDGESVSLDYMVHETKSDWRILNVIAQGISDLSLKRSEYRSIIKHDGFDALLQALDEKLDAYNNRQ